MKNVLKFKLFLQGFASALEINPFLFKDSAAKRTEKESLARDWMMIGSDIQHVINNYEKERNVCRHPKKSVKA